MIAICNRENKSVQTYSELADNELYYPSHLSNRSIYMNISDRSLLKRASYMFESKKVGKENVQPVIVKIKAKASTTKDMVEVPRLIDAQNTQNGQNGQNTSTNQD